MEVDAAAYAMSDEERAALPADKAFSQVSLIMVDLDTMLARPADGNVTFAKKKFGGE